MDFQPPLACYSRLSFIRPGVAHNVTTTVGLATKAWRAYQAGASDSSQALAKFQQRTRSRDQLIEQSREKLLFSGNGFTSWEASVEIAAGEALKKPSMSRRFKERLRATIADMTDSGRIDVGAARRSHTSSKRRFPATGRSRPLQPSIRD